MTEPENFLERWSKRKLAKGEPEIAAHEENPPRAEENEPATSVPIAGNDAGAPQDKGLDLGSLPPIESIGADTDVTAFLRPGVPPELTRAALRRAWSTDPAIRDFVGLVENGWDFNDPQAMGGFGPIDAGEVARLAGQIIGALPAAERREQSMPDSGETGESPPLSERLDPPASNESRSKQDPDTDAAQPENDATHKNSPINPR